MSAGDLVSDFVGWLIISFVLLVLFFIGAVAFGKNVPLEFLITGAGGVGIVFYGLYKGVWVKSNH